MAPKELLFDWQMSSSHGWGIYGKNLAMFSSNLPNYCAISIGFYDPNTLLLNPLEKQILAPFMQAGMELRRSIEKVKADRIAVPKPVLHAFGNKLYREADLMAGKQVFGQPSFGVAFFEELGQNLHPIDWINRDFRAVFAGSSWNRDLLKRIGVHNVEIVIQGVDRGLFHPGPKLGLFGDRFVVFSGGKLEIRKGQDLVVHAFSRFAKRHPDALLITTWTNHWPATALEINHGSALNPLQMKNEDELDIDGWMLSNGIPQSQFHNFGIIPNFSMPEVLRESDVALFTNRAEGGTNLVAMEAMACGLPVIISANTGHLDLIEEDNCIALTRQTWSSDVNRPDWGTSDVDEIVDGLERAYRDRADAKARGMKAAQFMAKLCWADQVRKLIDRVDALTS